MFHGAWQGTYVVTACTDTGDFRAEGFCVELGVGQNLPIALGLNQALDSAEGLMALGEVMANVQGVIDDGGVLPLNDTTVNIEGGTIKVSAIRLTVDGDDRLQGSFRTDWTFPGAAGYGQFDAKLTSVPRVSPAVAPASSGPSAAGSWRELVRRLKKR